MMSRYFRFGQFSVQFKGSQSLLENLPLWKSYAVEKPSIPFSGVSLILEEGSVFHFNCPNEGWNAESDKEKYSAAYVERQKVLFILHYGMKQEYVKIFLPDRNGIAIRPGLQFGMLTALHQNCVGLHGVTMLCGKEVVILSAPSGTGKTTLAHLLEEYCDAIMINGDFAMLSLCEEGLVFEPTPFCGTSGRSLNHRVKVDRIVFLEQSKDNIWQNIGGTAALVKLLSNVFIPSWDSAMQRSIQENILRFLPYVKINTFAFAPVKEAAEVFFKQLNNEQ